MKRSLGMILLAAALAMSGCGRVAGIPTSMAGSALTEAQKFTLKTPDGSLLSLPQVLSQKKAVLINFWATWCGYCVEEMPDLVKLQAKNESKGFTVLAVNSGESASQVAAFVKKHGINFPVVLDEDMVVSQSYGLVGIPTSFLVTSDGKIAGEYSGFTPKLVADVEKSVS